MTAPSTAQGKSADHFSLFGLPRKLWIEMPGLEQKFLQLSWKLHPDNFVNATRRRASRFPEAQLRLSTTPTASCATPSPASNICSESKAPAKKASRSSKLRPNCSKKFLN